MKRSLLIVILLISVGAVCGADRTAVAGIDGSHLSSRAGTREKAVRAQGRDDQWIAHETDNFCIYCTGQTNAVQIGARCESLLVEVSRKWLGASAETKWSARCCVVVHASLAGYLQAVGRGGQQTLGCSSIGIDCQKVVSRRIDIRGDWPNALAEALPHELTHVVIADAFADHAMPRWADEGIAVLSDSNEKQGRHRQDLMLALRQQMTVPLGQLMVETESPSTQQRPAFYGQSASLVDFLVERGTPSDFFAFVRQASRQGYDSALRERYGIRDVAQLEQLWKLHVTETASSPRSNVEPARLVVGRQ